MLGDRTGVVRGLEGGVADVAALRPARSSRSRGALRGDPRYGARIAVRALRARAGRGRLRRDLLDGPPRAAAQMEADLRELVATVQNPHLRALLDAVLGPGTATWRRSATRRRPSATTRPTATACSSTR